MTLYPTEQWLEAYRDRLNESEALTRTGSGWGVGFDGSMYFVITDVPIAETTLGDLPDEALDGIPEQLRGQLADIPLDAATDLIDEDVRAAMPDRSRDLLRQLEEAVVDGTIYAYLDLYDGGCEAVAVVGDPDDRDVGFVLRGSHDAWSAIVAGDLAPVPAVMSGDLEVDGDMQQILKYSDATALLGDIAADVETTQLF